MTSRSEIAARLAAATPGPNGNGILLRLDEVRALLREIADLEAKLDDAVKLAESNGRIAQIHKAANTELEAKVAGLNEHNNQLWRMREETFRDAEAKVAGLERALDDAMLGREEAGKWRDTWARRFSEEEEIVSRIWEQLGVSTYTGKSIYEYIAELQDVRKAAEPICAFYEKSLNVGPAIGRGSNPTREAHLWRNLRAALTGTSDTGVAG